MRCAPKTLNTKHFLTLFFSIMTKDLYVSLLRQGNTGSEILQILDTIASDTMSETVEQSPTLEPIQF